MVLVGCPKILVIQQNLTADQSAFTLMSIIILSQGPVLLIYEKLSESIVLVTQTALGELLCTCCQSVFVLF